MEAWHAHRRQPAIPHAPEDPAAGVLKGGG
jgi:hypothetical protein